MYLTVLFLVFLQLLFFAVPFSKISSAYAATTPSLGVAESFGILSGTYSNTVPGTTINGDLGYTTGPAVAPTVSGTTHVADGIYAQASIDQASALAALNTETCDFNFGSATDLSLLPQPLLPGVYCVVGAVSVGTAGITLSGSGSFIFRSDGALNTVANSSVTFTDGASACNLFWTPTGATTLGATSTFSGTVIDASGITVGSSVTWSGRALAFGGTVSTDTDTINVPVCSATPTPTVTLTPTVTPAKGKLIVKKVTTGGNAEFKFTSDIPGKTSFEIETYHNVGTKTFYYLAPGTYHIVEQPKFGWTMTGNECADVIVAPGSTVTCTVTNTKGSLLGEIKGSKFKDYNGNGSLSDDYYKLSGWTIYLDTNNNGRLDSGEPAKVTGIYGNYSFKNLPAGTYVVREVNQPGWNQTVPATGSYTVILTTGQKVSKINFGNFKLGTISGMKFNDKNGNKYKNYDEPGLAGWTIILTKKYSAFSQTTLTDSNGNYSFTDLGPGTYKIREVQKAGWHQMTYNPSDVDVMYGTYSKHNDFGNKYDSSGHHY